MADNLQTRKGGLKQSCSHLWCFTEVAVEVLLSSDCKSRYQAKRLTQGASGGGMTESG